MRKHFYNIVIDHCHDKALFSCFQFNVDSTKSKRFLM